MNNDNVHLLLKIAVDLANSLNNEDRFGRLLTTVRKVIACDAVALMRKQDGLLIPLAVQGLAPGTMGRRFDIDAHPRLEQICADTLPTRFPSDSNLPDPFDGLLSSPEDDLAVHSCLGLPLHSDGELIGVLSMDSLAPQAFDKISDDTLEILAALSSATLKSALLLATLQESASHASQLVSELTQDVFAKDGGEMIGTSTAMQKLKADISLVSPSDFTVLITGETGVGKELVARNVHYHSLRKHQPLVYLNCAALTETLAESELFGHVKGAFTGADRDRVGKFQLANGGTLFLDEVGELSLNIQSKLLRALQGGEIQPVGRDEIQLVNVRVIAATNRNLLAEADKGNFRLDLYHRLAIYPISVPPLKERKSDILLLANYFLERLARKLGFRQLSLTSSAELALQQYSWPGNVRELEHSLSRAAINVQRKKSSEAIVPIDADSLSLPFEQTEVPARIEPRAADLQTQSISLRDETEAFQRAIIRDALQSNGFNWTAAAEAVSMDRANLARLAKRLGITVEKALR
ncbi:nitric oxide reductase transcriptional regulator NorR [Alteromonas pelagimontana]|uniref:Nitric oxide reductase transcriptional regulator NorR n=1 Tax=Alteromonas pelagimontana TaxID=1858656 RepID=A0A6M4MGZ5_9ALTE|nr:nitric oxide reductase transcriptional regulator NorR [Alteromonas pelagimontana]QJR82389.1 nitric oxide reductase transcriptional regulator NorR [Alteromonas pelagimontana]